MDIHLIIRIVILLILLLLSAFFSSAETALTTFSAIRMRTLSEDGNSTATLVLDTIENKSKLLSSILIGNNIVNLFASALTTTITIELFGNRLVGVFTGILTFIILIFGEITPKTIATNKAVNLSLKYIKIIRAWMFITTPIIAIVNGVSNFILKLFGTNSQTTNAITEEELHTVLDVSHEEGVIEDREHEMMHNIIDFGATLTKDVMVPAIHVDFIEDTMTSDEIIKIYRETKHTRYPVFSENTDNIIGILNVKDILLLDDTSSFDINEIIREANFTYENQLTATLLRQMRKNSISAMIVLDEFGSVSGFITLEDLLEEIVGEIRDEYDEAETDQIVSVNESDYDIEGTTSLETCNKKLGINLESDDYDTLAGYIMEHLDKIPEIGDKYTNEENMTFVVRRVDKNRIESIRLHIPVESTGNEEV